MNTVEIKEAIARAMGFELRQTIPIDGVQFPFWHHDDPAQYVKGDLPDWMGDLNAAIQLCDKLAEEGWRCEINNGLDKTWECIFSKTPTRRPDRTIEHYHPAGTLAEAICGAFLRAKSLWQDQPQPERE